MPNNGLVGVLPSVASQNFMAPTAAAPLPALLATPPLPNLFFHLNKGEAQPKGVIFTRSGK